MPTTHMLATSIAVVTFLLPTVARTQVPLLRTAIAPAPTFPVTKGSFETAVLPPALYLAGATDLPWTTSGGGGIAHNVSSVLSLQPTPHGNQAVYLPGFGSLSGKVTLGTGTYRLRFLASQTINPPPGKQRIQVLVGGIEVAVVEPIDGEYRDYVTRPFDLSTPDPVIEFRGLVSGQQAFIDDLRVDSVARWDDSNAWNPTGVPTAADSVVIPSYVPLTLTGGSLFAHDITVNGELLTLDLATTLETHHIAVHGADSRFEVGQELSPFTNTGKFELKLVGAWTGANHHNSGEKFLMADDFESAESPGNRLRRVWSTADTCRSD